MLKPVFKNMYIELCVYILKVCPECTYYNNIFVNEEIKCAICNGEKDKFDDLKFSDEVVSKFINRNIL